MKYWRGYLVALILSACSWGLIKFAEGHTLLVDMVYPYVSRLVQTYLAEWSAGVAFCLWQAALIAILVLVLASVVLMIIFRWNPIRWFGWVCAIASVIALLYTGLYGLNDYAGPLSDDIHLEVTDYTITELEATTAFFRDKANSLSAQVSRNSDGTVRVSDLDKLSGKAADGYRHLVYEESMSVFGGSMMPVKELSWANRFTAKGRTGLTVPLTGESAVNPQTPGVLMPFAVCHEMAHRMCISPDRDANFSAFLACFASESTDFQYVANLMAYRYCYNALRSLDNSSAVAAAKRMENSVGRKMRQDLDTVEAFFGDTPDPEQEGEVCNLLVSWHIERFVIPTQVEEEVLFDPRDESQVDLSGIVNAKPQP